MLNLTNMLRLMSAAAVAIALTGCASLNTIRNDVTSFGPWPADRTPSSFAFERLPSQQVHPEHRQLLEDAARGPLEAAGFRAAADAASADYLVQVGARIEINDPWIYNAPLFWRGGYRYGFGYGRWSRAGFGPGPYWGPRGYYGAGFGPAYDTPTYDREVAVLIRDNRTGKLLYETRAASTGFSASIGALLPAMFEAAMQGFPSASPNGTPNHRSVTTQVSQQ